MRCLPSFIKVVCVVCLCIFATSGVAQINDEARAYYQGWQAAAERADEARDNARASNAARAVLRAELVRYREAFGDAREENAARIRILQSQIDALVFIFAGLLSGGAPYSGP